MNPYVAVSRGRLRGRLSSAPSIIVAAGLLTMLAAGCSAAGTHSPSAPARAGAPAAQAHVPGSAVNAGSAQNGPSPAAGSGTAALPAPDAQAIVYTASLTVRASDISQAAARAQRIATTAGGYVSSESTLLDRAHSAQSTVSLQLKIPVLRYPATLDALSTLGTRVSMSQQAQDVTETVADVTSRVASAQAAITQLRALLAHAGSVGDLLTVQNQIDQEESDLESLQSRDRALSRETSYGTVTLTLVSKPRAGAQGHEKLAGGFLGGLEAGWHGLRDTVSVLLTGAGAALPFAGLAALAALAAYGSYRARRWLLRRKLGQGAS